MCYFRFVYLSKNLITLSCQIIYSWGRDIKCVSLGNTINSAGIFCPCSSGDFGALHCQPAQKFDSNTQLKFCTSPPIEATRCYQLAIYLVVVYNFYFVVPKYFCFVWLFSRCFHFIGFWNSFVLIELPRQP